MTVISHSEQNVAWGPAPTWPEAIDNDLSMGLMGWFEHAFQNFDATPA